MSFRFRHIYNIKNITFVFFMRRRYRKIPKDHGDLRAICGGESCDWWMSIIPSSCKNFTQHLPGVRRAARTRPWVIAQVLFQPVGTGRGRIQKIQKAGGRETCQNCIKIILKLPKKKGWPRPPRPTQNPPLGRAFLSLAHY